MSSRFTKISRRTPRVAQRRATRRGLRLETLEDRSLLAFNLLAEYSVGSQPNDILVAALNADAHLDVATVNYSASVSVLAGQGNGAFDAATSSSTGSWSKALATGDVNGDQVADLLTGNNSDVSLLIGNGDGSFQPPVSITLPWRTIPSFPNAGPQPQYIQSIATGDLNEDGKMDLVATAQTSYWYCPYYCYIFSGDSYVNVLLGNGSGGFDPAVVHPLGRFPGDVAVADLNNDGHLDVITANGQDLSGLLGDGTGALGNPIHSGTDGSLSSLTLGDIDGDGYLDTVRRTGNTLILQKGQGDGRFNPSTAVSLESNFDDAVVGDVNADGKLDLVAVSSNHVCTYAPYYCYEGYTTKEAIVVLGTGQGGFAAPSSSLLEILDGPSDGADYSRLTLADLTGDGLPELLATDVTAGKVLVAEGNWPPADAPFLNLESVTLIEGDADFVEITLTASLSKTYSQTVTANFQTTDGGASADSDYQAASGVLNFIPGQTTQTINLLVYGDRLAENDESFSIALSHLVNANFGSAGLVTILENEPRISINHAYGVDPLTVVEGDGGTTPAVFTVSLAQPYDQEVTVDFYTLTGHTNDIISTSGTVRFVPGDTSETIIIEVVNDLADEPLEAFNVYLTNPSPNAAIVNGAGYCYIEDNDPSPQVTINNVSKNEGAKGTTSFVFTVTLSAPSTNWVWVNYATANGTATTADGDYTAASGSVSIEPGKTSTQITIQVRGDKRAEANETFFVNLSGATSATIADGQGLGTILNDDNNGGGGKKFGSSFADVLFVGETDPNKRKRN
jgi:hypothetical protein